jgi:hypothetical protein
VGDPLTAPSTYPVEIDDNGTRWTATVELDPPWLDGRAQAPDGSERPVHGWIMTEPDFSVWKVQLMEVRLHLWLGADRLDCTFIGKTCLNASIAGRPGRRVRVDAAQLASAVAGHGRQSLRHVVSLQKEAARRREERSWSALGLVHWQLAEALIGVGDGMSGCRSVREGIPLLERELNHPGARQLLHRLITQLERWPDRADAELRQAVSGTLSRLRALDQ